MKNSPHHWVTLFVFILEKKTFEVDASKNENMLLETKPGMLQLKTNDMNGDTRSDAAYWPFFINNEATPDASAFAGAAPASTTAAAAAYRIFPDAIIPLSGKYSTPRYFIQ